MKEGNLSHGIEEEEAIRKAHEAGTRCHRARPGFEDEYARHSRCPGALAFHGDSRGQARQVPEPGQGEGIRVTEAPKHACPRLTSSTFVCNPCRKRHYRCGRDRRCEYSAARADTLAATRMSDSRRGVDFIEEAFSRMMSAIRFDVARGLSPVQIAMACSDKFSVHPSTIYRWTSDGHGAWQTSTRDERSAAGLAQKPLCKADVTLCKSFLSGVLQTHGEA